VFLVVRIHVFYLAVWFQRERFEALLAVNFGAHFLSMKLAEKVMKAEIGGRAMVAGT
jgi:hypothetical protein